MHIAYVVSRFPAVTETFILREMNGVAAEAATSEVALFALFPAKEEPVHDTAAAWSSRCHHGSLLRGLAATVFWMRRAPTKTARLLAEIAWDYRSSPGLGGRALVTALTAFAHARTMERLGIDHVHAHFATYPALAAAIIHALTGIGYSVTPHAHDIFVSQIGLERRLSRAGRVIAVSRYSWMFLQHFGARADALQIVRYGVDLDAFRFTPDRRGAPPRSAVMVSSFKTSKGHRYLLEALAKDPRLVDVTVEFIGDGALRRGMEQLAADLGVAARCAFRGARDEEYVRERVTDSRVLVQPSVVQPDGDTEGLPNTIIEAAALGTVVVASRVTGVPELIEDGVSGFLTEPASVPSLADALHRALSLTEQERDAVVREARSRVEAEHDVRASAAAMARVFRDVHASAQQRAIEVAELN